MIGVFKCMEKKSLKKQKSLYSNIDLKKAMKEVKTSFETMKEIQKQLSRVYVEINEKSIKDK